MHNAKTRGRRPEAYPGGTLRTCGPEDDKVRRKRRPALHGQIAFWSMSFHWPKSYLESMIRVTGPSLMSATSIVA
jgi:hypothetical protein